MTKKVNKSNINNSARVEYRAEHQHNTINDKKQSDCYITNIKISLDNADKKDNEAQLYAHAEARSEMGAINELIEQLSELFNALHVTIEKLQAKKLKKEGK